jgi:hypothetical protein
MFRFLHKNTVFHILIIFGLLGIAFYQLFFQDLFFPQINSLADNFLIHFASSYPVFYRISVLLILIVQLFIIQSFTGKSGFMESASLLPSCLYLGFMVACKMLVSITPLHLINLVILLLIHLNSQYSALSIKNIVSFSGMLIGIAVIFDISCGILLLFMYYSILIHKYAKTKEFFLTLLSMFMPLIYFLSYYFLTDQWELLLKSFQNTHVLGLFYTIPNLKIISLISFFLLVIGLLYLLIKLTSLYSTKKIIMRKKLSSINSMSWSIVLILFITGLSLPQIQLILLVPFTLYFSFLLQEKKGWIFHDILITCTIIFLFLSRI